MILVALARAYLPDVDMMFFCHHRTMAAEKECLSLGPASLSSEGSERHWLLVATIASSLCAQIYCICCERQLPDVALSVACENVHCAREDLLKELELKNSVLRVRRL